MPNPRSFDLNLLRVFEAISHDGSISVAADKLGLSQPAVSNALNRLRLQFDDPLFVRTRHGMEPTPKAELLAQFVREGLATIRAGLTSGSSFDAAVTQRRFNLLMTDTGAMTFLPIILSVIGKVAPHIDLRISQPSMSTYDEMLGDGLVDLAIGRFKLDQSLCSQLIHTSALVVLISRKHRALEIAADGGPVISYQNYLQGPHVYVNAPGAFDDPLRHGLGADYSRIRNALTVPHVAVLPRLVGDTQLIATIPDVIAHDLALDDDVCICPIPFQTERNLVYQWWHKRNGNDAGHMWLRALFAKVGQELDGLDGRSADDMRALKRKITEWCRAL